MTRKFHILAQFVSNRDLIPSRRILRTPASFLALAMLFAFAAHGEVQIEFGPSQAHSKITVSTNGSDSLSVNWPASASSRAEMILNLSPNQPLIQSLAIKDGHDPAKVIASNLDPVTTLTIGERDKKKAEEAYCRMVFFENPREKPFETFPVTLNKRHVHVANKGSRTTIRIGDVSAGSFSGELRFTVYENSPLIHAEAVLTTQEELRAILYDAGLSGPSAGWQRVVWLDPLGNSRNATVSEETAARPLATKLRCVVAESENGSIAVFPAPHQYFYPLDFADNFQFNWFGHGYSKMPDGFGLGIRQPYEGDKRWVPWFDAPANKEHHLGIFYLLTSGKGEQALEDVARYTHGDRFEELPGHRTFTSHYHVEHSTDFIDKQKKQNTTGIPDGLETPGFVTKFKDTGVDIVHLAEFHYGWTPGQKTADRLKMLKVMHDECARLSDEEFLLLPGEEPNVHLGGHWISFFPKPVYWVLNRSGREPFVEQVDGYGTVYHVGNSGDVISLMERENGLMWTAHARIKASKDFPDGYHDQPFYRSDRFLGAAWKAMPADLSRPTLGWRVLDLLDDMNQWGEHKQVIGEVDVFKVQPDYELYAHMNINYLRLKQSPRFEDGWQPVLDALRGGEFFTTTGEILIPRFTVAGKESGAIISGKELRSVPLEVELKWTFPMQFAEVVSGDGKTIRRHKIDLSDTLSFGGKTLRVNVDLQNQKWVRFEVWDIAANGAFTQPVWIE